MSFGRGIRVAEEKRKSSRRVEKMMVEDESALCHGRRLTFFSPTSIAHHRFEDIRYRVKTKDKGEVEILHGINGCVRSGEVLAILGPSGYRKTWLIDALTMEMGELW